MAEIKAEIESRLAQKTVVPPEPEIVSKTVPEIQEAPELLKESSLNQNLKNLGTPLVGALKRLKRIKEIQPQPPEKIVIASSGENPRNIVYLLDGSSSMKKRVGTFTSFDVARKAIEKIFRNPNPMAKGSLLSVVVFWDEILKGFQKEILYENAPMDTQIDPQRLNVFGTPKNNAGTPLWQAVGYAIELLHQKNGQKTIKLITDAIDTSPLKDATTVSKLKDGSIQLDCIIVGSEGNLALGQSVTDANLGRFFESKDVESLVNALKA
jgi:hypothetical protein